MTIERLTEEQFLDSVRLSEYAFTYKLSEQQLDEVPKKLKNHQIYGIYENNKLAAKFHLIPLSTYVGDQSFKMGGIAGVATYPEYRRRGYVKELLTYALETMRTQGFTVSMLHPFDVSFTENMAGNYLAIALKRFISKLI